MFREGDDRISFAMAAEPFILTMPSQTLQRGDISCVACVPTLSAPAHLALLKFVPDLPQSHSLRCFQDTVMLIRNK